MGQLVMRTLVGGTVSAATGGKFANGAASAAMAFAAGRVTNRVASTGARGRENAQIGGSGSLAELSNAELGAYARGAGITAQELRSALSVGRWAVNKYQPMSVAEDVEYGGLVYRNSDGNIVATAAVRGTAGGVNPFDASHLVPEGGSIILDYHTHGVPPEGYSSGFFSSQDVAGINATASSGRHPNYAGGVVGTNAGAYFLSPGVLPTESYSFDSVRNLQIYLGPIRQ